MPILPALADWLRPHARKAGLVWTDTHQNFYHRQRDTAAATAVETDKAKGTKAADPVPWKANGLRHSFISYRLADIQNAAQVALEAGNSAAVVFKHYRELVKPADGKRWFNVRPERPANIVSLASPSLNH